MTFVYPTNVQASRASLQRAAQGAILRPAISRAPGGASSATAARATPAWRLRAVQLKQVRVGARLAQDSRRNRSAVALRARGGVGIAFAVEGPASSNVALHDNPVMVVGASQPVSAGRWRPCSYSVGRWLGEMYRCTRFERSLFNFISPPPSCELGGFDL